MDASLHLERQQQLQEQELIQKEDRIELIPQGNAPLIETDSKARGVRIGLLKEKMQKVTDHFRSEWERKDPYYSLRILAYGTETQMLPKNRSGTATDLMGSLTEMNEVTKNKDRVKDPVETVEKLFELSQAASNYCITHQKKFFFTQAGASRALMAQKVRDMTTTYLKGLLTEEEQEEIRSNEDAKLETDLGESDKTVEKDLKRAAKAYRKYRLQIAEGCMGYMPGGETLKKKLRVLRINDRLIKLYRRKHPEEADRDKDVNEMIRDYEECLAWEKLRSLTKQKDEGFDELIDRHLEAETEFESNEKDKTVPTDQKEELLPKQLKGIEEIDNWLIRNFKNGSNNDAELVDRLLSMSKRERLHTYFLVEMGRRRQADMADVGLSSVHTPSLERFKDQILATKLKFWKRVSGDYTYTHKLSDALLVTMQYRKEINTVAEIEREQKKLNANDEKPGGNDAPIEPAEEIISTLLQLKSALEVHRDDLEAEEKAEKKSEKAGLAMKSKESYKECEKLVGKLREQQRTVGKEKVYMEKGEAREVVTEEAVEYASIFGYLPNMIDEHLMGGGIGIGTQGIVGLIGAVTGTITLLKNRNSYSKEDLAEKSLEVSSSVIYAATSAVMIAGKFVHTAALSTAAGVMEAGVPIVAAAVSAGVAIAQSVAAGKMDYHGTKAVDLFRQKRDKLAREKGLNNLKKEEKRELKYEANMLLLQHKLTERQAEKAATSSIGAGLFVAGVAFPAILAPALAAALVTFIVGGVRSYKTASNLRTGLFDTFFNMDALAEKAMEKRYQEESKKRNLHHLIEDKKEVKNRIKEALRLRVAARAGFNSVNRATIYICSKFARLIRKKLFGGGAVDPVEKQQYIEFVQSINLRYNEKKKLPDENILVRKLNAM
ncbi:MAG: hypothetical protein IJJ13_03940 [Lachnospiraceae bacterium]|nr:hypothetical protein [Lachnospiraceae bacterium]